MFARTTVEVTPKKFTGKVLAALQAGISWNSGPLGVSVVMGYTWLYRYTLHITME